MNWWNRDDINEYTWTLYDEYWFNKYWEHKDTWKGKDKNWHTQDFYCEKKSNQDWDTYTNDFWWEDDLKFKKVSGYYFEWNTTSSTWERGIDSDGQHILIKKWANKTKEENERRAKELEKIRKREEERNAKKEEYQNKITELKSRIQELKTKKRKVVEEILEWELKSLRKELNNSDIQEIQYKIEELEEQKNELKKKKDPFRAKKINKEIENINNSIINLKWKIPDFEKWLSRVKWLVTILGNTSTFQNYADNYNYTEIDSEIRSLRNEINQIERNLLFL